MRHPTFGMPVIKYFNITLCSSHEFCENLQREGRTFLMGANKIIFSLVLISSVSPQPHCLTYILHLPEA
jgi:hypothetical protein